MVDGTAADELNAGDAGSLAPGTTDSKSDRDDDVSAATQDAPLDAQQQYDAELMEKIVKQVNFYFSDTNLPSDNFLLKEVHKTLEGWVPIRLIASFKKIKALTGNLKLIVAALQTSAELVVSGHRVRRKEPLPEIDVTDVLLRTAIVDNLPEKASIDSLTQKFSSVGQVKMVRICAPNSGPRSTAQSIPGADVAVSRLQHALVEFDTPQAVTAAVQQLTDSNNWRSGLRVRPLLRTAFKPQHQPQAKTGGKKQHAQQQQPAKQPQEAQRQGADKQRSENHQESEGKALHQDTVSEAQHQTAAARQTGASDSSQETPAAQASADESEQLDTGQRNNDDGQAGEAEKTTNKAPKKGQRGRRTKKDYAAWAGATPEARATAVAHLEGNPDAVDLQKPSEQQHPSKQAGQPMAPGSAQPKMPDGSRGFVLGRGRPLAPAVQV